MKNYEVIIIGGGVAGLYAALALPPHIQTAVLTKYSFEECNSNLAQGGIAGVWDSPEDSILSHKKDTLNAGGNTNRINAVDVLVREAHNDLANLVNLGVDFDKVDNDYHRTLEGGHSHRRIFHRKDYTGKEILSKLFIAVSKRSNITVFENEIVLGIKKNDLNFSVLTANNTFNAHFLIMATGGIGRCYKYSTNASAATGDGIAFAYELGANIKNISKIQFHPTAFKCEQKNRRLLISEAVRGEGAYLLNSKGERFMSEYDLRLELAPRDVVSKAMYQEGCDTFYIDITHKPKTEIISHFPNIYNELLKYGFDMSVDKIPVYPCQHYLMGGIDVDINANTSVENLYAVGECSHTGLHGNNRLASNSLMEACVFSRLAAADIAVKITKKDFLTCDFDITQTPPEIPEDLMDTVQDILQKTFFIEPNFDILEENLKKLNDIRTKYFSREYYEEHYMIKKSITIVSYLILEELWSYHNNILTT
ncbi:MAG: FAD-binding protein [Oscillospiraceae bacterium]|jgi:L-aspartate oxidase|nr:FAD-binding protein [Oscillospiraceae bacterium]